MKAKTCVIALVVGILFPAAGAGAAVYEAEPTEATVLSADHSGLTKVVLRFDLSGLREGEARRILDASIEWPVQGVSSEEISTFSAYEVTRALDAEGSVEYAEEALSEWEITPADYEQSEGFVRLDVKELAVSWAESPGANLGVLVATPSLAGADLMNQLGEARLIVRYGFFRLEAREN
jgi:hypothetical protein